MNKSCGKCGDSCSLHMWDEQLNAWVRCKNADQSIFYLNINQVPAKYRYTTWDQFQVKNEYAKQALAFAKQVFLRLSSHEFPKKSLIYSGKDFSGKTMLTSILLRYLAIEGFSVGLTSLTVLTDLYFSDRAKFHEYFLLDVLVIQLGSEISNASSAPIVQEIFKERYHKSKYTIFTSKNLISEMAKVYSKEMQDFFKLEFFKELQLR